MLCYHFDGLIILVSSFVRINTNFKWNCVSFCLHESLFLFLVLASGIFILLVIVVYLVNRNWKNESYVFCFIGKKVRSHGKSEKLFTARYTYGRASVVAISLFIFLFVFIIMGLCERNYNREKYKYYFGFIAIVFIEC